MSVLFVSTNPGEVPLRLIVEIDRYDNFRAFSSTWFIDTLESPAILRQKLEPLLDPERQLYVARMHRHWASARHDEGAAWLNSTDRSWD